MLVDKKEPLKNYFKRSWLWWVAQSSLILAKLVHLITYSWWWVLVPLWASAFIAILGLIWGLISSKSYSDKIRELLK